LWAPRPTQKVSGSLSDTSTPQSTFIFRKTDI
jgi:hypothetical protein